MPNIFLKPNSPEFADTKSKTRSNGCEMPGCSDNGPHKAPKNRGLNEYYYFCFDHVREYNKAWNFFTGMSDKEVEDHMHKSMYGDRPTWRYDNAEASEDILRRKTWQKYNFTDKEPPKEDEQPSTGAHGRPMDRNSPEYEAMSIMGLAPPVTLETIKIRYKKLAKKHHPDLNRGCSESEELLKEINMAYTILKLAFEQFEKLPNSN